MKTLIVGATSQLGVEITNQLNKVGHELYLSARSYDKLCKESSLDKYNKAHHILWDMRQPFINAQPALPSTIDNIIIVASSTSHLADDEITDAMAVESVSTDLLSPYTLVRQYAKKSHKYLNVVLISSILSDIRTPGRTIYSGFKSILSQMMLNLSKDEKIKVRFSVVKIGTRLDRNTITKKHKKIAKIVVQTLGKQGDIAFGREGKILSFIYKINPFLMGLIVKLSRFVKSK